MNTITENFEEIEFDNQLISRVRSMVERVIRCIKVWKVMYTPFRGQIWQNHGIYAQAVMQLVQWQFEINGHPTFDSHLEEFVFGDE